MASNDVPGYGGDLISGERVTNGVSGTASSDDATNEPGQYPVGAWGPSIFGGALPLGTGAPGTQGARHAGGDDPTNEPGQTSDGLTGITDAEISQTGAPGTTGGTTNYGSGPDAVTFTRPGSYLSGTYESDTVHDSVSGIGDWTGANDAGYASGGPQLEGIKGNEPTPDAGPFQPKAGGRVMRGGRMAH